MHHSREWEKINSRSRCREFPRCQIHGVSLVHQRNLERNRSWFCFKIRISLDLEMDGRRFDVGVSDCLSVNKRIRQTITNDSINNNWNNYMSYHFD
jgi:hypothetical protein